MRGPLFLAIRLFSNPFFSSILPLEEGLSQQLSNVYSYLWKRIWSLFQKERLNDPVILKKGKKIPHFEDFSKPLTTGLSASKQEKLLSIQSIFPNKKEKKDSWVSFFRFVSPYALNEPAEPDQGFTISGCSTAIDRREALLRSHMLLSGNRKGIQEPQKLFSLSLHVLPFHQKNFLSKESLPTEVARGSFFLISF